MNVELVMPHCGTRLAESIQMLSLNRVPNSVKYPFKDIVAVSSMDKYQCNVCGYIYDPEMGDTTQSVPPGTPFEDLPDDWTCPECGAGKDEFTKL